MQKTILVSADHGETRAAVLENGRLVEFAVERGDGLVGNIYKGRVVNVLPGMDAAFVDIGLPRNAFIYVTDVSSEATLGPGVAPSFGRRYERITHALQIGQQVMVQVVRPPVGGKGARVSTRISLPGRYVVLLCRGAKHVGLSRRIEDEVERERLLRIGERLRPLDHGLILRTEAETCNEAELRQDTDALLSVWKNIEERFQQADTPSELHRDFGLAERLARDMLTDDVTEFIVNSQKDFERVVGMLQRDAAQLARKVRLHAGDIPLFEEFDIESAIAKTLAREVPLPHGGHITIDETEALTCIDVDTGRFTGKRHLADTILTTNLEAVEEVARQLRLRDIGGIIIVDFIDMDRVRDRIRLMDKLQEELRKDRAGPRIIHLSPLGLVELTRRRGGRTVSELLCQTCPYCSGRGRIRCPETVAMDLRRKLRRVARRVEEECLLIRCHPEVGALLIGTQGELLQQLEAECGKAMFIQVQPDRHLESHDICSGDEVSFAQSFPPILSGEEFTFERNMPTYPSDSFTFATFRQRLVLLPEVEEMTKMPMRLRIRETKRWFATADIAPEPTELHGGNQQF